MSIKDNKNKALEEQGYYTGPSLRESQKELSAAEAAEQSDLSLYKPNKAGRGRGFLSRHKRRIAAGVIASVLGIGGIGFFGLKSFELVHIMKGFQNFHFGASERTETRRSVRLIQYMMDRNKVNDGTTPEHDGSGRRQRTGRPIADAINNYRLDKFEGKLNEKGYKFTYGDPADTPRALRRRATGLELPDGTRIDFNDPRAARADIRSLVNDTIPAYRIGKRFAYYRMINRRTGWSRKFYFADQTRDAANRVRERFKRNSRSAPPADAPRVGEEDAPRDQDGNPANETAEERAAREERNRLANQANQDVSDALQDIEDGATPRDAASKLSRRARGGVMWVVGLGCIAVALDEQLDEAKIEKYQATLEYANQFNTMADQMKTGGNTVSSEEVGESMAMLHDITNKEHFDTSAEYQRVIGNSGQGVPLDPEARLDDKARSPSGDIAAALTGAIGSFPGFGTVCKVLSNSVVAFTLMVFDFATAPVIAAVTEALARGVLPQAMGKVLEIMSNGFGCTGDENAIQTGNCIGLSFILSNLEHIRGNMGGLALSPEQHQEQQQHVVQERNADLATRSIAYRYLSLDNPYSLTTKLAISRPRSIEQAATKLAAAPSAIFKSIAGIFYKPVTAQEDFDNHGLPYAGFTDEEVDSMNPESNEQQTIEYLRYYCWKEIVIDEEGNEVEVIKNSNGNGCDKAKLDIATHMREFLRCTQLPYPEAEEAECFKKYNRTDPVDKLPYEKLLMVSFWMFDHYTVTNLAMLNVDGQVNGQRTYELLMKIEDCVNQNAGENKPATSCILPPDNETSIFHEDPFETVTEQSGGNSQSGGEGSSLSGDLPSGTAVELAQVLLDNKKVGKDAAALSDLQATAGGEDRINRDIIAVLVKLGETHTFTITNMRRDGSCSPGSRHPCGKAADLSGTRGIDGVTLPADYGGNHPTIRTFLSDAAKVLPKGSGCQLGVPNQTYVNHTKPKAGNCYVFIDIGSGPHIHLAVP